MKANEARAIAKTNSDYEFRAAAAENQKRLQEVLSYITDASYKGKTSLELFTWEVAGDFVLEQPELFQARGYEVSLSYVLQKNVVTGTTEKLTHVAIYWGE